MLKFNTVLYTSDTHIKYFKEVKLSKLDKYLNYIYNIGLYSTLIHFKHQTKY